MIIQLPDHRAVADQEVANKVNELVEGYNLLERAVGLLLHHHLKAVNELSLEDFQTWEKLTKPMRGG